LPEIKPESQPHLTLELRHRLGALSLDVAFELTHPWTILFGPSGSGKSTILRAIAGLIRPEHAKITLRRRNEHQIVADTSAKILVSPHQRFVRWSAQRPALFPHMTVRDNLRFATAASPDRDLTIASHLERFHIAHIANRLPDKLSGGEQQRASIARAACSSEGRLLLLDEPFTGLDATLRDELVADLQSFLAETGTPVLSVTHDISEAFQLNAEVLKLHSGRITAQGPAAIVLAEERTRLLAQLNVASLPTESPSS
jgi:molybdate transport system ATP-binding protein